jgi:hypothetical protein
MLCVFLDCLFLITPSVFSNVYLSCVLWPMLSVSLDCSFLITHSVFSNVYLSCVLCDQCCQCLWIVHSWLPLQFSLTFICPVSCVTNVVSISGLFILYYSSVFCNVFLSCVLCDQCCVCFWIVYSWLPLQFSLTFICRVSCVTNVVCVSGLSILDYPFSFL